jgi:DNA-binding CsgD family transcriptional regulator
VFARLERLSASARRVVVCVASMAQPTVTTIHAVAVGDAGGDALTENIEAGILELDGERIRLTHPLLGSVAYRRLDEDERRRLHGALAGAVSDAEERGRHLALAAEGPDEDVAVALDDGTRHAAARGALDAAATLAELAWRATPREQADALHRRALAAVDLHFGASEMVRAAELAAEALEAAAQGPERAALMYRLAVTQGRLGRYGESLDLLEEALHQAAGDPRVQSQIELELGMVRALVMGELGEGLVHAKAALRWAARAGEPRLQVSAMVWAAGLEFVHEGRVRRDLFRRGRELEETAGAAPPAQRLAFLDLEAAWGMVLKWADDPEGAREKLDRRLRRALLTGDESVLPLVLYHLAELECWAGNWEAADRHAADAVRAAEDGEQPLFLPPALYAAALVDAHRGHVERAREEGERALGLATSMRNLTVSMMSEAVLGFIDLSVDDHAGAVRHLGGLAARLTAMDVGEPGIVRFPADAVEALLGIGEIERAARIADDLEERGRAVDRPWARATGARSRGLVQAARGELDGALDALDRALVEHRRLAVPFELGRTHLVKGTIERRAKRKGAAKRSLSAAVEIFERLGAPVWAEKARTELGRTGLRPKAPLELTPTELRIAELVKTGMTSREVAAALFVSVKTVDANLTRIYRKLGVRSRTELAARDLVEARAGAGQTRESP